MVECRAVNMLIPAIALDHFFGGYIGKFNLARRLLERGIDVRIVTVDPVARYRPTGGSGSRASPDWTASSTASR